jgi:xylan 1,4-beta-xylosidase
MNNLKTYHLILTTFFLGIEIFLNTGLAQSPSFETYTNPVIPGDHPDATLTRIGNDFYTTGSSFNVTPVIFHSTDLVHWEAISQPVKASWSNYDDNPGGGCWGGHIVYYNSQYWHYFSRSNTMYFVTSDDPGGPWSDPVKVNNPASLPYTLGYDNSIFIDDDNKWYLLVKNGQANGAIVELDNNGQCNGAIYNLDWLNPAPSYPYSWAEGPVMWKYKGYYYYSFARDLAGGQKVMRSETLTDDENSWEMLGDFFNESDPQKQGSLFTSPNHASPVIMLDDSTYWIIHPLYAKGEWKGQGRQGLLNQVHYDSNLRPVAGYPVNQSFIAPGLSCSGIPWMVPKSDLFTSDELDPEWSLLGYTPDNTYSLADRPGWLHLSPKSSTKANTVIKNDGEHNYSLITHLELDPQSMNDEAGLRIMRGDETKFVKLYSSVNEYNHKVIVFSFENTRYETDNTAGNTLWLKIIRVNHSISGYFSSNGCDWVQVGKNFDVSEIDSYSDFVTFTGTRQGLYVQGSDAFFDLYIYRDAYTPILAECPANHYGTCPTTKTDGIYQLDSIHNNDWALYAGVEFGNDEYLKAPKTIEVTASSAASGGKIEVWLDSMDTGPKIADCEIFNTGDWNTFVTFTAPVEHIEGRHDVYLRFTGAEPGRLFKLKWIQFIAVTAPEFVSASVTDDDTLQLKLSQPVIIPSLPSGLNIEANGSQIVPISDISLAEGDSSLLVITLAALVSNTDEITISYDPGTITNPAGISLIPFSGLAVDNLLPGAAPRIKLLETKDEGDTVWMYLSKKMNSPASYASDFTIEVEGKDDILINTAGALENDSTIIVLLPESRIYYEDMVSLTYSGTELDAVNGGLLASFTSVPIQNIARGYPPNVISASIRKSDSYYKYIDLTFDKPMLDASEEKKFFTITLNDVPATIQSLTSTYDLLSFSIYPYIQYGDEINVSYSGGNVRSRYNGILQDFSDYPVTNTVPQPLIINPYNNAKTSEIVVFPNPTHSEIQVSWGSFFSTLSIFSSDGRKLIQKKYSEPVQYANLKVDIALGVYLIMLENKKIFNFKKIVIE